VTYTNVMSGWETYDPNPPDGKFPWVEGIISLAFIVALVTFLCMS